MQNKILALLGLALIASLAAPPSAFALGTNVIKTVQKNVGEDKIPLKIKTIQLPANALPNGSVDLESWVNFNFGADTAAIHLIGGSMREVTVKGKAALLFKAMERESIIQNLLLNDGKALRLYSTPHLEINKDGATVFRAMLGFTPPTANDTSMNVDDYMQSLMNQRNSTNNSQ